MTRPSLNVVVGAIAAAVLAGLGATVGCSSNAKKDQPPTVIPGASYGTVVVNPALPEGSAPPPPAQDAKMPVPSLVAQQITSVGDNYDARFSVDGTKAVFTSRSRPSHRHAQIYELDLVRMLEKRLTFHDGDDGSPTYYVEDRYLYSSGTDEIKEEATAIEKLKRTYVGKPKEGRAKVSDTAADLYLQTFNGREIERLTNSLGFDGEADYDARNKRIAFTSSRTGLAQVHLMTMPSRQVRRVSDVRSIDRMARFSPDGAQLTWSRSSADGSSVQVLVADGDFSRPRVLTSGPYLHLQPTWHPGGQEVIFSANRAGKFYNLYSIDREGKCLKRLTTAEFDQTSPAFSPDGKYLLFTGRRNGQSHLYIIGYQPPADCMPEEPKPETPPPAAN